MRSIPDEWVWLLAVLASISAGRLNISVTIGDATLEEFKKRFRGKDGE